jgi:molecular chaperone DnaK (HSP70)
MDESVFGIDLGTTNSVIATLDETGRPVIVRNAEDQLITPSVVQIREGGDTLVGEAARRELALEMENTARFFKRDMGTPASYVYRGREWTPLALSAEVLKKLKRDAEARLRVVVRRAVVTVPAYFQDGARVATREAGRLAGLEVIQVVNEPTAAAIAYGLKARDETVLVYDLGGGTFDISLVLVTPGAVEVVGTDGNHNLGGKDWDDRLAQYICQEFRRRHGVDPLDDAYAFQEILARTEEAKCRLSSALKTVVAVNCGGRMDRIEVSRDMLDALTRDLLAQTETLIEKVLEETRYDYSRVSGILLVGGSTRMPACRELVRRLSGREPNTTLNPDECVAAGAAIQAAEHRRDASLGLARRMRIDDVMSHSMGMIAVSAAGDRYLNSILIPKNKRIPCREVRPYLAHTRPGGENSISVYVTQGESEDPADCSFVGKYVIGQVPHGKSGRTVLDIAYEYDRSGVVSVSATARGNADPLPVRKETELGDMAWVLGAPREAAPATHKTIYAAVDLSGSMSGEPLNNARRAMLEFVARLDLAHTSVGLISFADKVRVDQTAVHDARALERAAAAWKIGPLGYGNAADPFADALRLLGDIPGERFLVVLTDGVWAHPPHAESEAKRCHKAGIAVIAIGFGSADEGFLRRIASADTAALFVAGKDLAATFGDIAQVLVESEPGVGIRLRQSR